MSFEDLFDFLDQGAQAIPADTLGGATGGVPDLGPSAGFGSDVANLAGANDAFTNLGQQFSDTAGAGTPPGMPAPSAPAATVDGGVPNQASAAPSAPFGGEQTDPEQLARQGADKITSGPIQTGPGSEATKPVPTAWESIKNAPGKWWDSAVNEFDKAPIATTAKVGALAAPFVGAGIAAANAPKAPGKYTLNPPASTPASAQAGSDTMPTASPMSTTLTGQGGFKVQPGQGFAQGGVVSDQDKADYDEAMRQFKGQPAQPQAQPKPKSAYDQQLEDADQGKQQKPASYFKSPWSR